MNTLHKTDSQWRTSKYREKTTTQTKLHVSRLNHAAWLSDKTEIINSKYEVQSVPFPVLLFKCRTWYKGRAWEEDIKENKYAVEGGSTKGEIR